MEVGVRILGTFCALLAFCCFVFRDIPVPAPTFALPVSSAPATPPDDKERVRSEIREVEKLLPETPERGAALFFLAELYKHLGEVDKVMVLLEECVALDQGFDPGAVPGFQAFRENARFREMVEQVRRRYRPVQHGHVAFTVADKDLFPEGLAVDPEKRVFYMGSMHRKKILQITASGEVSDFAKAGAYDLMPVGGLRVDPVNHDVWAASDPGVKNRSELLHFDSHGKLLERFPAGGAGPHDLNDLVVRGAEEVYTTDTDGNAVLRLDRKSHRFTQVRFPRPIFYPNGIALSGDAKLLYVSDILGVMAVDLLTHEAWDVVPDPHDTLAGIDGLYWYRGDLVGVQYGTAAFRVMRWHLASEGRRVESSEILERGSDLVKSPTTGAIFEGSFYFMANTGIENLRDDTILDESKLEPVRIAVVPLK